MLAQYQLVNLESIHPAVGAAIAVLVYEFLVYWWHRAHARHELAVARLPPDVHHSAERVDSFGVSTSSPLDVVGWTVPQTSR